MKTSRIESIELCDMLPRVFENENIPESQVWRKRVALRLGERYMIEAASGGGKSSLCSYIYGARTDYFGRILFNGDDVAGFDAKRWQELRRRHIAYLPQELMLFPELTALDNIMLKGSLADSVDVEKVRSLLEELGIGNRADYPVGRMSIGQQQRVAIIRAVCQPFDFILLDEPVSHLDEQNNRIAADIIEREARRYGAAVVSTSVGNRLELNYTQTLKL